MVSDGNEAVRSHALISMLDIKDRKGFISNDALMHMKQALGYYPEDELQQSFVRGLECTENNQMAGHFQMPKNLPRHDCTSRIPGKSGEGMDDPEPFILTAETRLKTRFPAKYRAFLASEVSEINNYLFFVVHDPCHFKLLLLKCNNYWETTEMLAIGIDPRNETFGILKRFLDLDDPPVHRFRHEENQFVELSSSFSSFIERIKSNQRN